MIDETEALLGFMEELIRRCKKDADAEDFYAF